MRCLECPRHGDLRKELSTDLLTSVLSLPKALTLHSWTLQSCFVHDWISYLVSIPEVPDESLRCFDTSNSWDIFTDGSCLWQDQPNFRLLASWAVCIADPITSDNFRSHVVAAGPLQGVCQTSFRAECYALLRAIRIVKAYNVTARIWTDCQGVLDRFLLVCHGRLRIKPNSPNADLCREIIDLLDETLLKRLQVAKVAAHVDPDTCDCDVEAWLARHNNAVDNATKQANYNRPDSVWDLWEKHAAEVNYQMTLATEVRSFQLAVGKRVSECHRQSQPAELQPAPTRAGRVFVMQWDDTAMGDQPHHRTKVTLGKEFAEQLQQWWSEVVDASQCPVVWLSFVQLYILFQLECRHPGLVRVGRGWKNPGLDFNLIPENASFRQRVRWFRMCLQQFFKDHHIKFATGTLRPQSTKLTLHIGCVSCPAKPCRIAIIEKWLCEQLQGCCISQGNALDCLPCAW